MEQSSAEILCIGTELLLGHVLDTNSQFIAEELADLGINCFYRTTVGDNKERIKKAVKTALDRADILITSGGLGPTPDDLTTECLAELFNAPLEFDQAILDKIQGFFTTLGYTMPPNNRKQALRPAGARALPNPLGTAPGIIWQMDKKVILTFPGVSRELHAMWKETARPFLEKNYSSGTIWSCRLKHYGIGESALAQKYAHLLDLANPTVATYAGPGECRITVAAKAKDKKTAESIARPIVEEIIRDSGDLCYGFDEDTLESVLAKLLIDQKKTIAVAESCTGGLVSQRLTDIPGSSQYIKLNVITYSNEAKMKMLNVSEEILAQHGAVSAECAEAMAHGMLKLTGADLALSVTGIAGPGGGSADKPVGLVYLGLASTNESMQQYKSLKLTLPVQLTRKDIRQRAANAALNMARLFLLENK